MCTSQCHVQNRRTERGKKNTDNKKSSTRKACWLCTLKHESFFFTNYPTTIINGKRKTTTSTSRTNKATLKKRSFAESSRISLSRRTLRTFFAARSMDEWNLAFLISLILFSQCIYVRMEQKKKSQILSNWFFAWLAWRRFFIFFEVPFVLLSSIFITHTRAHICSVDALLIMINVNDWWMCHTRHKQFGLALFWSDWV